MTWWSKNNRNSKAAAKQNWLVQTPHYHSVFRLWALKGKIFFTRVRKWKGRNCGQRVVTLKTEPSPRDFPPVFPSSKSKMPRLLTLSPSCLWSASFKNQNIQVESRNTFSLATDLETGKSRVSCEMFKKVWSVEMFKKVWLTGILGKNSKILQKPKSLPRRWLFKAKHHKEAECSNRCAVIRIAVLISI